MSQYERDLDETELRESLQSSLDYCPLPAEADARLQAHVMDHFDQAVAVTERADAVEPTRMRSVWMTLLATAACLAGVILVWPAGKAYSFESMVQAIQNQPLMRAVLRGQSSGAVGWLRSGPDAVVAVEVRDSVYWWDDDRNETFQYLRDKGEIADRPEANSASQALLQLLTSLRQNDAGRIVSESWRSVDDHVELTVKLELATQKSRVLNFVFGIDPETELPQWVRVESALDVRQIDFRYPDRGPTSLASLGVRTDVLDAFLMEETTVEMIADATGTAAEAEAQPDTRSLVRSEVEPGTVENSVSISPSPISPVRVAPPKEAVVTRVAARRWQSTAAVTVPDSTRDMTAQLDQRLTDLWKVRSVRPVGGAEDHELIRRLYLDLTGRVPLVHEIDEARTLSREQLVEQLLASRDFSTHMATVWSRLLLPDSVDLSPFGGVEAFNRWLAGQFRDNVGYDELVRKLLQAEGRVGQSGPVLFYTALELKPDHLAKQTARVFLGSRIDCAQCHDHPTDDWTQVDFWAYAAFFARISRPLGRMEVLSPVLRVRDVPRGDVKLPDTETIVAPRFLGGESFEEQPGEALRRKALADWLTSSRQFARATVNHVWTHFFGVGFVVPADDFGPHNPAIAPETLDELAEFFVKSRFDLRELVRVITATRAYQMSSQSQSASPDRLRYFAQMNTKWLTAEQLYDAITTATRSTQVPVETGVVGIQRFGVTSRDAFVEQFKAPRGSSIDYQAGIPQALALMNGGLTLQATESETSGMMQALTAPFFDDTQRVETIFLACVGRPPDDSERDAVMSLLAESGGDADRQTVLSDLFWALLNTSEFATNH